MPVGLLKRIIEKYLNSRDFNGFNLNLNQDVSVEEVESLLVEGLIQVACEEEFPNPHILPWQSRRSIPEQIASIKELDRSVICLYPTNKALKTIRLRRKFRDSPYSQEMARGRGTLELAFFNFDVLEYYRNDPRFVFSYDDFEAKIVISNEADLSDEEPDHDKIFIDHVGFAYDLSKYEKGNISAPITRRVCAFLGRLNKLSPVHQQRWKTFEVRQSPDLKQHPIWWAYQMGHWPDGIGPFSRFFYELEALDRLNKSAFGVNLFKTTERPREFGWILRPSQSEWDLFIQLLDKLLSDNLRHKALDMLRAPVKDDQGNNLGTLKRLEKFLIDRKIRQVYVDEIMQPFFEVREARNNPSHKLRENINNPSFIHLQVDLMSRVCESISGIRRFWQIHPLNKEWEEPSYLKEDSRYFLM